jgi:hypothetical protein
MPIRNISGPFGIYVLWAFGNLVAIWYIFLRFGILCQEKSGIPGVDLCTMSSISALPRHALFTFQKQKLIYDLCSKTRSTKYDQIRLDENSSAQRELCSKWLSQHSVATHH